MRDSQSDNPQASIALIGGSGLYQMEGLTDVEEYKVVTPFGDPSDGVIIGTLEGVRVAFVATIYPALQASRLEPVDAIRHD